MIKLTRQLALACIFALAAVGCSDDEDVLPPAPLPDFDPTVQLEEVWDTSVGDGLDGNFLMLQPAVTEQALYAASHDGEVLKLALSSGKELWEQELDFSITGGVGAGYGLVVLGSSNGEAIALSEKDGAVLWKVQLSGQVLATPAVGATRVIVQTMDGRLHALNPETGAVLWVYDTAIPVLTLRGSSHPVILGNVTLAGFSNGKLVALDTESGFVGWEKPVSEPKGRSELERLNDLDGRFWVTRNIVYATTYQGNVVAIDISSGRILWAREMSSFAGVSEFLGQVAIVDDESNIYVLDAVNGSENWKQDKLRGRNLTAPTAWDRFIIVGDFEGYLHWLNYRTGEFVARVKVDGDGLWAPPVVKNDMVFVQGNSGELAAYKVITK